MELRERPRGARLREPAAPIGRAESRRAVVPKRRREIELIEDVEGLLSEVRLVMNLVLVVGRGVAREGVENAERLRRDEPSANIGEGAEVACVQILAGGEGATEAAAEVPGGGPGQIVIDLVIDDASFGDAAAQRRARAVDRASLQTIIVRDV